MGYTSDSIGSFRRRFAKHANVSLAPLTRMITEMENTSNTRQSAISGQQVSRAANDSSLNSEEAPEGQRDSVEAFVKRYKRSSSFRERILKVHGAECAVCDVRIKSLIQAAHIRPVADNGSDSDGNGIPLCPTHHDAFDQHLFTIDPDNKTVVYSQNTSAEALGINKDVINYTLNNDDVTYRYFLYLKSNDTGVHRD